MSKRFWVATFGGGLVLFGWSFVSHMLIGWHHDNMNWLENEKIVAPLVAQGIDESGIYLLPFGADPEADMSDEDRNEKFEAAQDKAGFFMFAAVRKGGMRDFSVAMPMQFLSQLLSAGLAAWFLLQCRARSFGFRILVIELIAIFAFVVNTAPNWIWWGFSTGYTATLFFDGLIGWALAGAAMARLLPSD